MLTFLLQPIAKKQRWFYEPVLDEKSPYWDAPISHAAVDVPVRMALVDGYLSAVEETKSEDNDVVNTLIAASVENTGLLSYRLSSF